MPELPPLNGKPKRPSKYAPKKCPGCGEEMEDGECEDCSEKEEAKKIEIKLSILLPGGED
jgi:hypothetical protein